MTNEEQTLTEFLQSQYSEERLLFLLAHAESGRLAYVSCCCFIGVVTADHALKGEIADGCKNPAFGKHVIAARKLPGGYMAETAYAQLGEVEFIIDADKAMSAGLAAPDRDAYRRAKLIPLIRAEIERRERERSSSESLETVLSV